MKKDDDQPWEASIGHYLRSKRPSRSEEQRLIERKRFLGRLHRGNLPAPAESVELSCGVKERKHLSPPKTSVYYDLRKPRWWRKPDHSPEYQALLARPNPTEHGDPHTVLIDQDPDAKGPRLRLVRFSEPGPLGQRVARVIRARKGRGGLPQAKTRGRMVMTVVRELIFDPELVSDQGLADFTLQLSHEACQLEQESQERHLIFQERRQEAEQRRLLRDERSEQVHDSCRQLLDNAQRILGEKPFR